MSETKFRVESDLIGELQVPIDAYYGVQTQRALNNYKISNTRMCDYPEYIIAMAYVKMAAAAANAELGVLDPKIADAIVAACKEIVAGKLWDQFPVDMMQGGAGTSVNMNANEVIANRALELMGHKKGEYQFCSPNDHVNCAQSTNDAYPSAFRYTFVRMNKHVEEALRQLIAAFRAKGEEFKDIIKMGRTQLQDAVPMTSGQEFNAFANNLEEELANLERNAVLLKEINMGGTAIGTGLNAVPSFAELCTKKMSEFTGDSFEKAPDLVEATPDTGAYVSYSAALKRLAVKLSKTCNDLRLMASGPRCGLHEINLPAMAPGSSIMPGKVNPVIPEVTNQVCFKVLCRRGRPAAAQRDGARDCRVHPGKPDLAHQCNEHPPHPLRRRHHRQCRALPEDGQELHWHCHRPESVHWLQSLHQGGQRSPGDRPQRV